MPSAKKTTRTVEKSAPSRDPKIASKAEVVGIHLKTLLTEELKKVEGLHPSKRTAIVARVVKRLVYGTSSAK